MFHTIHDSSYPHKHVRWVVCAKQKKSWNISSILLVWKWDRSRVWATRVFIAEIVLIVFSFILIGIVGSFVSAGAYVYSTYSSSSINYLTYGNNYSTKYAIMQAQLAFGILLLFSGVAYIVFYCVVTYLALWKPFQTLDTPHLLRNWTNICDLLWTSFLPYS